MANKKKNKSFWWYASQTIQALGLTAVAFAPEIAPKLIQEAFPAHTLIYKLALPIGFFLKSLRYKIKYQKDELPSGMSSLMDKIDNKWTGVRGSKSDG